MLRKRLSLHWAQQVCLGQALRLLPRHRSTPHPSNRCIPACCYPSVGELPFPHRWVDPVIYQPSVSGPASLPQCVPIGSLDFYQISLPFSSTNPRESSLTGLTQLNGQSHPPSPPLSGGVVRRFITVGYRFSRPMNQATTVGTVEIRISTQLTNLCTSAKIVLTSPC